MSLVVGDGGRSYPIGSGGLSEVLSLGGLRSLRLHFKEPPEPLYLAEGFSELTALTAVELRLHDEQYHVYPKLTFSTLPCPQQMRLLIIADGVCYYQWLAGCRAALLVMSFTLCLGGEVGHLPALEVLFVDCHKLEAPISSKSLLQLEIAGSRGRPYMGYPGHPVAVRLDEAPLGCGKPADEMPLSFFACATVQSTTTVLLG